MDANIKLVLFSLVIYLTGMSAWSQTPTAEVHDPSEYLSGTLPVMYINTQDSTPITSKINYIEGSYWLDATGFEDRYESIGSREEPLPLQIIGRGNASWFRSEKKPYRVKLGKKAPLLGMEASKHFCLMAHISGIYMADLSGFELSRRIGKPWTPEMRPVELVLNGDYVGLYWITEQIRIAKKRVNITEQANGEENPEAITGGWLMEIDNMADPNQFVIADRSDSSALRTTWHSPDTLSPAQLDYIKQLVITVDSLIYVPDKNNTEWERYIDIDELVRFYIVNEMVDNTESFSGSCFWYKDRGADAKIIFGPVWDFGSVYSHATNFIYCSPAGWSHQHWIGELAKFNRFQQHVRRVWQEVKDRQVYDMDQYYDSIMAEVRAAAGADLRRWPDLVPKNLDYIVNFYKTHLKAKCSWLDKMWGGEFTVYGDLNFDNVIDIEDVNQLINMVLGHTSNNRSADLNFDEAIDIEDINILINRLLRKDT